MRVGLHTGTIVGGMIGSIEASFDIFGNDVLIASKVESKSFANGVAISQTTFDLVKQAFQFSPGNCYTFTGYAYPTYNVLFK